MGRQVGRILGLGVDAGRLAAAEIAARMGDPGASLELEALLVQAIACNDIEARSRILEALGLIELGHRRDGRAAALLQSALDLDVPAGPRERPALHRALGRAYAGMGDLTRAIAVLSAAFDDASADPPDAALMTLFGTFLANAYTDAGLFGEAEAALARVLRHRPDLAPGNVVRLEWAIARTYVEQGRPEIAETYVRRVLARVDAAEHGELPGQARLLLARVLSDQGRLDEAVRDLDEAERLLASAPGVELAALSLDRARVALARDGLEEAEGHLRRALDRTGSTEPGQAGVAYGLLGEVELRRGNIGEARFLCRRALEVLEGTATPLYADRVRETLADVEERAGDLAAALAALRSRSTSARSPRRLSG
jgi:tetratricopeptide (TPR) repeat protein